MPSGSFYTLGDTLNTKLSELVSSWLVWTVYNYDPKVDGNISTPCIIITPDNWGEEIILDNVDNKVTIPYLVAVMDQGTENRSSMETNMRSLVDAVIEKIKEITSVSYSNWELQKIEYEWEWWWTNDPEPYRTCLITVNFLCVESK